MNRYDTLKLASFTPRSMEELAVVPGAFRQKHDRLEMAQEALRMQANASVNPLAHHSELARSIQDEINGKIDAQAQDLAQNGFSNASQSNMIKLNRDYQNVSGPNGMLGKINAARTHYYDQYKQFREDAIKAGHSPEAIDANWAKQASNYTGYDQNGNISLMQAQGAPKKYTTMDFAKEVKSLLGEYQSRLDSHGITQITIDPTNGDFYGKTKTGSIQRITNLPGIKHAEELFRAQFLSPDGDGYKSAQFEGKSPIQSLREGSSLLSAMITDKINDTVNYSTSFSRGPRSTGSGSDNDLGIESDLLMPTKTHNVHDTLGYKDANTLFSNYDKLHKVKNRTAEQESEYQRLKKWTNTYAGKNQELIDTGNKYNQHIKSFKGGFNPTEVTTRQVKTHSNYGPSTESQYLLNGKPMTRKQVSDFEKWKTEGSLIVSELKNKRDIVFNQAMMQTQGYTFAKSSDPAVQRKIDAMASNILTSISSGNADGFSFSNIVMNNSNGKPLNPDGEQIKELKTSFNSTPDKYKEIVDIRRNPDGTTSYDINVLPNKESHNVNLWKLKNLGGGNKNTEKGYTMTVTTSKLATDKGINTGHGRAMLQSQTLGPNSAAFGQSNAFGNFRNNFEKTTNQPYTVAMNAQIANGNMDPSILREISGGINSPQYNMIMTEASQELARGVGEFMTPSQREQLTTGTMSDYTYQQIQNNYLRNQGNKTLE